MSKVWVSLESTNGILRLLSPHAYHAFKTVCKLWGEDVYLNSMTGDMHIMYSLHYRGDAFDVFAPKTSPQSKIDDLVEALGIDYDVIYNKDKGYVHVEYDPGL